MRDKFESYPGDILLVHKGTLGQIGLMPKNRKYPRYIMGNSMLRVRCDPTKLIPEYLYYWLCSREGQHYLFSRVSQVGVPQIQRPLTTLREASLPVPPLDEQKAIAHILGTLDDKIELNQQINHTLEAIARALFKSWFIDFDPVRAKMDGRQPAGMDAETAALFPDEFEDSAIGKIPNGWKIVPLPELIEVNPRRSLTQGKLAPYLDMQNMPTQGHRPNDWIYREFSSGTKFIQGDTLLARITPCLENGKTAFVDFLPEGEVGWGSTEYIILRPKPPLPVEFGYFLARSQELRTHAIQNMTGSSGRQRVPVNCFLSFLLTVPSNTVAREFGDVIQPIMRTIKANSEQIISLNAIRDTLLPKLLLGEIEAVYRLNEKSLNINLSV
nr:restriction endonuclease subunit S [Nostoc sp. ChiSLP03a]MDZ8215659.1 restriction endonuclease subunit S [Nostoc sp. ChiSLP03a]